MSFQTNEIKLQEWLRIKWNLFFRETDPFQNVFINKEMFFTKIAVPVILYD